MAALAEVFGANRALVAAAFDCRSEKPSKEEIEAAAFMVDDTVPSWLEYGVIPFDTLNRTRSDQDQFKMHFQPVFSALAAGKSVLIFDHEGRFRTLRGISKLFEHTGQVFIEVDIGLLVSDWTNPFACVILQ